MSHSPEEATAVVYSALALMAGAVIWQLAALAVGLFRKRREKRRMRGKDGKNGPPG